MSLGASPSFDSMSNFPNGFAQGLQVQGMPVLNSYPGRVFWLDSVNGSDNNRGTFQRPFASLSGALGQMASPGPVVWGDVLMVKPGHRETISSATALSVNLSGVQIIGLGVGMDRPTWTLDTANTATITVTGQSVSFQNCRFVNNFLNIAAMFTLAMASVTASISGTTMTVSAVGSGTLYPGSTLHSATSGFVSGTRIVRQISGTTGGVGTYQLSKTQTVASGTVTTMVRNFNLRNCDIADTSSVLNALIVVKLPTTSNGADNLTLFGNTITLANTGGVTKLIDALGTNDRVQVANNIYRARTTDTGAVIPIATGKTLTNAVICDNVFDLVSAAGATTGILVTTDQTANSGVICRNFVQALDATTPILVTASSGFIFAESYYASAADKSGALLPTT